MEIISKFTRQRQKDIRLLTCIIRLPLILLNQFAFYTVLEIPASYVHWKNNLDDKKILSKGEMVLMMEKQMVQ